MHRASDPGVEGKDQGSTSIQYAPLQPNKNSVWPIITKIVIDGASIVSLLIIGAIIWVFIRTYVPRKDLYDHNIMSTTFTVDVIYRTNLTNTNSLVIANPHSLSANLMNELNLTGIKVLSAGFGQVLQKRQAATTNKGRCDRDSSTIGNFFAIQFSIKSPMGCCTDPCLKRFETKVPNYISDKHPQISLTMTFTNTLTLKVELSFCSFSSISTSNTDHSPLTKRSLPTASVITGITRIDIYPTTDTTVPSENPTFGGRTFGTVGAYEKIRGRAYGQLNPKEKRNQMITDLKLAPCNSAKMVEYSMDFYILKPINLSNGNHKIFFEVNNRGNKLFGPFSQSSGGNNPTTSSDAGQAFLLNQGYTIAWCGWDPSVSPTGSPDLLRIYLPVATNKCGSSITGPSYEYIVFDNPSSTLYTTSYNTNSMNTNHAKLTMRNHLTDPPVTIPSTNWIWTSNNTISLLPINTAFKQSWIYELTYAAKDPYVAGIGFAATRDFVSFLRSNRADNPLAGDPTRVISWSLSQPARYINDFIWLGFNEDLRGKQVFDGVFNWIGAGTGIGLNYRFAQSARTERNRQDHLYPEASFPFSYTTLHDHISGEKDGRNIQCMKTSTCPKIMSVNSANEYWVKTGSLLHTDLKGNDLVDPSNVRHYLISGTQHGGPAAANSLGICQQFGNAVDPNPVLRALFVALDKWLDGTAPPPSMIPRRSDDTAVFSNITANSPLGIGTVSKTSLNWPAIPNVLYTGLITVRNAFNFGPQFDKGIICINPPNPTGFYYPSFVSKVDIDGNELAGIRLPPVAAPFATTAGWNLRLAAYGGNDGCEATGSLIPFAPDMSTRIAKGDPRVSLTERYGNHAGYVTAVTAAANALVSQRLLLSADVQAYITAAQAPIQVINNPVYGNYTW